VTAVGVYFFYNLKYIIKEEELIVRMGFITDTKIAVKSIRKIEKSRSLLSAPALSIDRLLITFNTFDDIIVSPKDKFAFVDALKMINPDIEIAL
jgi:hypothetical protein